MYKKGMFLKQERHFLERRRACVWFERSEKCWHGRWKKTPSPAPV